MKPRHLNELLNRLEKVTDIGFMTVRKEEMKFWFDTERVGKKVFASIDEFWRTELDQNASLFVGESAGEYVFIWSDGLDASSKAWFQDVRDKARGTLGGAFKKKGEKSNEAEED